jgi:hypothetical protein
MYPVVASLKYFPRRNADEAFTLFYLQSFYTVTIVIKSKITLFLVI